METEVLSGLHETIRRWRPTIFIEVWESKQRAFLDWCARESYHIVDTYQRYQGIQNYLIKPVAAAPSRSNMTDAPHP